MTVKLGISLIKDNFVEIHSTLDLGEQIDQFLVGSLWTDHIYNETSGLGKMWKVFYFIVGKRKRDQRLNYIIARTQQAFDQNLKVVEESAAHFSNYIVQKSQGTEINDNAYLKCRSLLTKWFDATHNFLDKVHQKNPRIHTLFQQRLNFSEDNPPSILTCEALYHQSQHLQYILDLEGWFQGPLPYRALRKLSLGEELSKEEEQQFKSLMTCLNKYKRKIDIRFFNRFLKSLVEEFGKGGTVKPSLEKLQMAFVNEECEFFLQRDYEHLAWRSQLKSGDILRVNGKEIVLGERIGEKSRGFDRTIHFAIQGDKQKIVSIPINEAILGTRKCLSKEEGYVLRMPEVFEIDASGAYAIMERLADPLDLNWLSQRDQFAKEDEDRVGALATVINWLHEKKISPANLSPRHLMFSASGELKTLKLILKTACFDINMLQAFVLKCSAGNFRVFQHLMEASNLRKDPYGKFYKQIISISLDENIEFPEDQAKFVIDPCVEFYKQIIGISLEGNIEFDEDPAKFVKELAKKDPLIDSNAIKRALKLVEEIIKPQKCIEKVKQINQLKLDILILMVFAEDPAKFVKYLARQNSIIDPSVIKRAIMLVEEVKELQIKCIEKVQQNKQLKRDDLVLRVSNEILRQYKISNALGVIWPSLADHVQEAIFKNEEALAATEAALAAGRERRRQLSSARRELNFS